ncbi:MAG: hypothetical protein J3R72DRAFT_433391 [Linnemannia gamsii]|nr:MAG: hypothetical protein J3R72DRAFT_433391 [Linnemannia gamsii]
MVILGLFNQMLSTFHHILLYQSYSLLFTLFSIYRRAIVSLLLLFVLFALGLGHLNDG